jgi:uncharacterized membrane protein
MRRKQPPPLTGTAALFTVVLAIVGVVLLSVGIVVLHRQIERRIDQIGRI